MGPKIIVALGAVLLLALGSAVADARGGGHGGGGGHFGGGHFGGGHFGGGHFGGGHFAGRSFRSGPSFSGRSFRAPHIAGGGTFRGRSGRVAGVYNGRWRGGKNWHHRRGRYIAGYPYYGDYYYDDYGYDDGDDCGWLYRRAIQTGSAYWWRRYQVCEG